MSRKKTEICVNCGTNKAQDGRFCHSCRNESRKDYYKERYEKNGGYKWHRTKVKEFKIRQLLLERSDGCCESCGWSKAIEVLQIHHKDRDKKNNSLENLEFLCPTCHLYHHFLENTGLYHPDKGKWISLS